MTVLPGSSLVVRRGNALLVIAADESVVSEDVIALIKNLLDLTGENLDSVQGLARRLIGWLISRDDTPGFGLIAAAHDNLELFLYGSITARFYANADDGAPSAVISGQDAGFSVDRLVPLTDHAVILTVDSPDDSVITLSGRRPSTLISLYEGIVPGNGAILWTLGRRAIVDTGPVRAAAEAAPPPPVSAPPPVPTPTPTPTPTPPTPPPPPGILRKPAPRSGQDTLTHVEPSSVAAQEQPSALPDVEPGGLDDADWNHADPVVPPHLPSPSAFPPGDKPLAPPRLHARIASDDPSDFPPPRAPLPVISTQKPGPEATGVRAAVTETDGSDTNAEPSAPSALVRGFLCSRGHLNDPRVSYCARCGIRMDQLTGVLVEGARPPLGLLVVDDGSTFVLDSDLLVGRDPDAAVAGRSGRAADGVSRLASIRLADSSGALSRVHLELRLVRWQVVLVDAGSVNGTFIRPPQAPGWLRLGPGQEYPLETGSEIRIGNRSVLFESPHGRLA